MRTVTEYWNFLFEVLSIFQVENICCIASAADLPDSAILLKLGKGAVSYTHLGAGPAADPAVYPVQKFPPHDYLFPAGDVLPGRRSRIQKYASSNHRIFK